jgi:hypothetical protein
MVVEREKGGGCRTLRAFERACARPKEVGCGFILLPGGGVMAIKRSVLKLL